MMTLSQQLLTMIEVKDYAWPIKFYSSLLWEIQMFLHKFFFQICRLFSLKLTNAEFCYTFCPLQALNSQPGVMLCILTVKVATFHHCHINVHIMSDHYQLPSLSH